MRTMLLLGFHVRCSYGFAVQKRLDRRKKCVQVTWCALHQSIDKSTKSTSSIGWGLRLVMMCETSSLPSSHTNSSPYRCQAPWSVCSKREEYIPIVRNGLDRKVKSFCRSVLPFPGLFGNHWRVKHALVSRLVPSRCSPKAFVADIETKVASKLRREYSFRACRA